MHAPVDRARQTLDIGRHARVSLVGALFYAIVDLDAFHLVQLFLRLRNCVVSIEECGSFEPDLPFCLQPSRMSPDRCDIAHCARQSFARVS